MEDTTRTRPIWSNAPRTFASTTGMRPRGNGLATPSRFAVGQMRHTYRTLRRNGVPCMTARDAVWTMAWVGALYFTNDDDHMVTCLLNTEDDAS